MPLDSAIRVFLQTKRPLEDDLQSLARDLAEKDAAFKRMTSKIFDLESELNEKDEIIERLTAQLGASTSWNSGFHQFWLEGIMRENGACMHSCWQWRIYDLAQAKVTSLITHWFTLLPYSGETETYQKIKRFKRWPNAPPAPSTRHCLWISSTLDPCLLCYTSSSHHFLEQYRHDTCRVYRRNPTACLIKNQTCWPIP